jgi:hypothetical protein
MMFTPVSIPAAQAARARRDRVGARLDAPAAVKRDGGRCSERERCAMREQSTSRVMSGDLVMSPAGRRTSTALRSRA